MATGTANSAPLPPPVQTAAGELLDQDRFIHQQLDKTRLQLKVVDLFSDLMVLACGVMGFFLVVAIVDHWLFPLGFWGRLLALLCLLGASGYYCALTVIPLLVRRINPMYAARAIEQSTPSLKNSLLNFLTFRGERRTRRLVYAALRQQAATDLAHVAVDAAVDRSRLIRIGYVLACVLATCTLYAILSPKNPLQTVARVAAPWADISSPSRVEITNVLPGDGEFFQGELVTVSATVTGLAGHENPRLVYSTIDQQTVDRTVVMQLAADGLRHECVVPATVEGSKQVGLQQDLVYRIEAGDTRTADFHIRVSPAPAIVVEQIEFEYPTYTQRAVELVERQGDIKALEGTRVTIRARANHPIHAAHIEFDPAAQQTLAADNAAQQTQRLTMQADQQLAWQSFLLELDEQRTASKHAAYQVRFLTPQGLYNEDPTLHRIEVTRDLPPEIEVLTPAVERVDVPANGQQPIEVRAIDPDYGLSRITLRALKDDQPLLEEVLFDQPPGLRGQTVAKFDFVPAKWGLAEGAEVVFWAEAADNRMAPGSTTPQPNLAETHRYRLVIVPPVEGTAVRPPDAPKPDEKDESKDEPQKKPQPSPNDAKSESQDSQGGTAGAEGTDPEAGNDSDKGESGGAGGAAGKNSQPESEQTGDSTGEEGDDSSGREGGGSGGTRSGQPSDRQDGQAGEAGQTGRSDQPLHPGEVIERINEFQKQHEQHGKGGQHPAAGDSTQEQPRLDPSEVPDGGGREASQPSGEPAAETRAGEPSDVSDADRSSTSSKNTGGTPSESADPAQYQDQDQENSRQGTGGTAGTADEKRSEKRPKGSEEAGGTHTDEKKPEVSGAEPRESSGAERKGDDSQSEKDGSPNSAAGKNGSEAPKPEPGSGTTGEPKPGPKSESDTRQPEDGKRSPTDSTNAGETSGRPAGKEPVAEQPNAQRPAPGQPDSKAAGRPGESESAEAGADERGSQPGSSPDATARPGEASQSDPTAYQRTGDAGKGQDRQKGAGEELSPADRQNGSRADPDSIQSPQELKNRGSKQDQGEGTGIPTQGGADTPEDSDSRPSRPAEFQGLTRDDKANLEYSRRATQMALEYLKDQKDEPDPELLKKLNMTKEELRRFYEQWERMNQAAARGEEGARRELDESLRSLGLRPTEARARRATDRRDTGGGLSDEGAHREPPPGLLDPEQYNAYRKSAPRSDGR